jgi:uncharacterized protein YkwD
MKCAAAIRFGPVLRLLRVPILLSTCLVPGIPAEGGSDRHITLNKYTHIKHKGKPERGGNAPVSVSRPVLPAAVRDSATASSPVLGTAPSSAALVAGNSATAAPEPPIEEQIFALTNQARQANDLMALGLDPELTQAAQIQASAMALLDTLDHDLPGMPQPTLASRLLFVGYHYSWAAENIASGAADAPSMVALWLGSPPHAENIMSPIAVATGVAVARDSQGVLYFCQVFGEPR